MSLRRMVRLILSCVAVAAVAVSGATPSSGAQTTAENDWSIYAVGYLNPFLVAKLTIMGLPGDTVQVGQRALLHSVSDRWVFEDGAVTDAAGAIIAPPFPGLVSAVSGSQVEVKLTAALEGASDGSPGRPRGLAAVFEIEGCSTPDSRASADSGSDTSGPAPSATVEAAEGLPDAAALEQIAPASIVSLDMPLPDVGPEWSMVQEYLDTQGAWSGRLPELEAGLSAEERRRRLQEAWDERPDIRRAIAAATANRGCRGHARPNERRRGLSRCAGRSVSRTPRGTCSEGRVRSVAHVPDYERWTRVLAQMDARRFYGPAGESWAPDLDRFFEELASGSENPTVRAMARYYAAAGLMQSISARGRSCRGARASVSRGSRRGCARER